MAILDYDTNVKKATLKYGLSRELQASLVYQAEEPQDFAKFVDLCMKLDYRIHTHTAAMKCQTTPVPHALVLWCPAPLLTRQAQTAETMEQPPWTSQLPRKPKTGLLGLDANTTEPKLTLRQLKVIYGNMNGQFHGEGLYSELKSCDFVKSFTGWLFRKKNLVHHRANERPQLYSGRH
jgi:hypothetical protein